MGKTWLVNKMAEIAENHPKLKCGWVRYEVTPTDSVDSMMALIMDNAFEAGHVKERSWDITSRRLEKLRGLLNLLKVGDLVLSLWRGAQRTAREDLLKRLALISKRMPSNGRAVFVIDPDKHMQAESDQAWAVVTQELPEKIKLLFGQRPDGVLVNSERFSGLDNVVYIPDGGLGALNKEDVGKLVELWAKEVDCGSKGLLEALSQYEGHPYAVQGALGLLTTGSSIDKLPQDPSGIAVEQWREICRRGRDAVCLFEAYAVLEVSVPDHIVEYVAGLDSASRKSLLADSYIEGLVRQEKKGSRIYHAILADHILSQIGEKEKKKYYNRLVEVYGRGLDEYGRKDKRGVMRLSRHIFVVVNAGQQEIMCGAIEKWLAEHKTLPEAQFVYKSWLDAGGDIEFVREGIEVWLGKHKTLPEARFVYKSWLDAGGDIEFVREHLFAWFYEHGMDKDAVYVYIAWFDRVGDLKDVQEYFAEWCAEQGLKEKDGLDRISKKD